MRLTLVGTADAFNAAGRGHSCTWVDELAEAPVMVDFGPTALMGLNRCGLDPRELAGIALTHLHGDHFGGLPLLWIDALYARPRTAPLSILGPPGTREAVLGIVRAFYGDVVDRELPFTVEWTEIHPGQAVSWLGLEVRAWHAPHLEPPALSLGLRLARPGGPGVAFTGDTQLTAGVLAGLRGADIAVVECSALEPPAGKHVTWLEWRDALAGLGVPRVVLTHLGADVRAAADRIRREAPDGVEVIVGEDGIRI
ncbi:MAG: MBL fold metallo-hydrolase [Acidobacteriota bacterium]